MINTRFGSEVEVLSLDLDTGLCHFRRKADGAVFEDHTSNLRADGGLQEIIDAAPKAGSVSDDIR